MRGAFTARICNGRTWSTVASRETYFQEELMYRSLLVPLDGSDFGEHALPLALSLARRLGAALQVVHVHAPAWGAYGELGGLYDEMTDRVLRERDRAYVDEVVQRLAAVA